MTESGGQDERRRELADSADARAVRTRQRILVALEEAVDSGGHITVGTVTTRAGVARSTFYTHFSTLDDVVAYAIDEIFDEVSEHDVLRRREQLLSRREITELGTSELFAALSARRSLLAYAAAAPAGARLRERLVQVVRSSLRPVLVAARPDADADFLSTAGDFLAGGLADLVLARVDDPRGFDARLARQLIDLLPGWMTV